MADSLDRKIIKQLENGARVSAAEIAKTCRIPKETVNYRIRRLLSKGAIKFFYSIINSSHLGYSYHRIFLQFNKITSTTEKELVEYLQNAKSCANVRILEGPYDMVFLTTHKHLYTLRSFMSGFLDRFGGVIKQKSIHTIFSSYRYSVMGNKEVQVFSHGRLGQLKIDEIDSQILEILSYEARISLTELAKRIGADHSLVRYRLKRLQKEEVIVDFVPALDYRKFGKEHIQIDFSLRETGCIPAILSYFDRTGTLLYAYELIGKYDLSVEVIVEDDTELRDILNGFREGFAKNYSLYDVSHVYQELFTNWSPFSMRIKEGDQG